MQQAASVLCRWALAVLMLGSAACQPADAPPPNYWADWPAVTADSLVHAVIEIPAGTTAKWMVDKDGRGLRWERENGARRVIRYLGYPANYGIVPQTLLPRSAGGDGDPLDIVVLGDALERGTVVPVRLIGVLRLIDRGEQDDKLIAVRPGTPLGAVRSIAVLDAQFPGITSILATWFTRYKGAGEVESDGYGSPAAAWSMVSRAQRAYARLKADSLAND